MTLTNRPAAPRRRLSFRWLVLTFCAVGILLAAFFNLGAARANLESDTAGIIVPGRDGGT